MVATLATLVTDWKDCLRIKSRKCNKHHDWRVTSVQSERAGEWHVLRIEGYAGSGPQSYENTLTLTAYSKSTFSTANLVDAGTWML